MNGEDKPHPHKSKLIIHDDGTWKYTGGFGTENNGHLHAKKDEGAVTFRIDVVGNRWEILRVDILDDDKGQLSNPRIEGATASIDDANTVQMSTRYCVSVRGEGGRTIRCDPMMSNEPRG